jgi:hypothetical protein
MTAILKVDTIQDTSGNNIINESSDTITIGAAGDTVTVPGTEVKSNKLSPASGTALQIGDSGDTITIPSGATITNSGTATNFGGTTAPYCSVYRSSDLALSSATWTTVVFNSENVDSNNAFNTSTGKFTPQVAGQYFVSINIGTGVTGDNTTENIACKIMKNTSTVAGSSATRDWNTSGLNYNDKLNTCAIAQLNGSSDYISAQINITVSSGTPRVEASQASMQIFKMTE